MTEAFRFPSASKRDPAVDSWFDSRPSELGTLARFWFDQLRQCGPDIRELIHDGCPVACVEDVAFAYVNVYTAHASVGFFFGANLDDPESLLTGAGKHMRHVKLRPDSHVDSRALGRLIEDAYQEAKRAHVR